MKKGLVSFLLVFCLILTGCSSTSLKVKQEEISKYNTLIKDTLSYYEECRLFAEKNKQTILNFILTDDKNKLGGLKTPQLNASALTKEDIASFSSYATVHDLFFTSYGATSVREVILIVSGNKRMYITIVWGKDEIISFERELLKV